ncbi:cytochrome P450 [Streptomyces sp. HNM0574]|uniref:cytochrome P450 family protein n=1 Tax=Streptomyces sp. HNM0574 TaxID=2714954 RepID=UPI00146C1BB7|nr:cytochrome P450 [Streptomyces sp. HNM0574]NLU70283.1 cytochrome P450 [Streptomyces sp. HNM0574]
MTDQPNPNGHAQQAGSPHPALPEPVDLGALARELGEAGDFLADPRPAFAELLSRGPVHRVLVPEVADPAWVVVGHAEARAALADPRLCNDIRHSRGWQDDGGHAVGRNLLQVDPPDHTRLRRLVAGEFTARRIGRLRPRVQEITDELLDAALPAGHGDLVEALAEPLPIIVICELLGVPAADRTEFRDWSQEIVAPTSPEAGGAASQQMAVYLSGLIEEKRKHGGDDLLAALVRTHDADPAGEGEPEQLSDAELLGMAFLLLVAGYETTVGLIGNGVRSLLEHPEQLAALRADPTLTESAVEEMLRYDGPALISAFRFPSEPVELGGAHIPAGDPVIVAFGATGHDPERFARPESFDIRRAQGSGGHQGFGHGVHHCLGAPLARLEATVAVGTLLRRCPDLALDADPADLTYRRPGLLRALTTLPVRFGA